jgi:conjugative transfer pilus assembly protein TraH
MPLLQAEAEVDGFEKFVKKLGMSTNNTSSGALKDQSGGYYTGGSFYARSEVKNLQLASIELPSIRAGCGGIDLFKGGFSYINSEAFEGLTDSIAQGATGYIVQLAVETVSPLISNLLKNFESAARFINSSNVSSCQIAASAVAGVWPKTEQAQRLACTSGLSGGVADYFSARNDCSKMDEAGSGHYKNKQGFGAVLGTEYNLVYEALTKAGITDKSTLELLMSVSGTFISKLVGGKKRPEFKESLIKDKESLMHLIKGRGGKKIKLYNCNDSGCLNMSSKEVSLEQEKTMKGKILNLIDSIINKIMSEDFDSSGNGAAQGLSPEEKSIIELSKIPILKEIKLQTALKGGDQVSLSLDEYTEPMAFGILVSHLENMLDQVRMALNNLEQAQFSGETIQQFKKELRDVREILYQERQLAFAELNLTVAMHQRSMQIEKHLDALFGEYMQGE